MHTRRAGQLVARPLNCGVIRLVVVLARLLGSNDANDVFVKGQLMSQRTSHIIVSTAALVLLVTTRWCIAQNSVPAPSAAELPWPPGPAYPAAFNRTAQDGQVRRLEFLGEWRGANGATEFAPGTIKSDGIVLGEYSIVAHEEFVAVLEVTSPLYSAKYWRLDAIDYSQCGAANEGLDCARPYEPGTRLVLTMYEDVNDALSFSRKYLGRAHYFSFRKAP